MVLNLTILFVKGSASPCKLRLDLLPQRCARPAFAISVPWTSWLAGA